MVGENVAYIINDFDVIGHLWKETNEDLKPCTETFHTAEDISVKGNMIKNIGRKFRKCL